MALVDVISGIVDQLVDDGLGGLLLIDDGGSLAHQVGASVVDCVVVDVIGQVLEVVLNGDNTLSGKLLDILGTVILPVLDVGVLADTEGTTLFSCQQQITSIEQANNKGTYSEDDGANSVVEAGGTDSLLVSLRGTGLIGQDEAGTNPDSGGAQHQRSSNRLAVVQTTGGDNLHGIAGHRALVALDQLGNGRDKDGGGDITSVSTTLTTLGADDVCASVQRLLDVLGVTDHVHVEDSVAVEAVDNGSGRNTDSRDKELSAALNDDVDKLVQLSLGVVVAKIGKKNPISAYDLSHHSAMQTHLVFRALPPTCGSKRSTPKGAFLSVR